MCIFHRMYGSWRNKQTRRKKSIERNKSCLHSMRIHPTSTSSLKSDVHANQMNCKDQTHSQMKVTAYNTYYIMLDTIVHWALNYDGFFSCRHSHQTKITECFVLFLCVVRVSRKPMISAKGSSLISRTFFILTVMHKLMRSEFKLVLTTMKIFRKRNDDSYSYFLIAFFRCHVFFFNFISTKL